MYFVLFLWLVYWIEMSLHLNFGTFGVLPRTASGLKGILFSPFIHLNISHIANNSIPLLVLLAALNFFYRAQTFLVICGGIFLSGFMTWVIGRQNYHIGASSLIYVLISFMFFKGIFTKYFRLVALSFAIVLLYGSSIWLIFPTVDESMSWEGHLSGFFSGFLLAKIIPITPYQKPKVYEWEKPDFDAANDDFMKNFDENGNFRDGSVQVDTETLELHDENIVNQKQYIYHYKEKSPI